MPQPDAVWRLHVPVGLLPAPELCKLRSFARGKLVSLGSWPTVADFQGFFRRLTYQCTPRCAQLAANFDVASVLLDLGAGGRRIAPSVTTIDVQPSAGTDVVASVYKLPIRDESSDLVFATGLLEHLEDERKFLREVRRVLKIGGIIHVEIPFLQQYHEDPIDCRRYTVPGLTAAVRAKRVSNCGERFSHRPKRHLLHHCLPTMRPYCSKVKRSSTRFISNAAFVAVACIGYPLKYLDVLLKIKNRHKLAFGVYCTLRKLKLPKAVSVVIEARMWPPTPEVLA